MRHALLLLAAACAPTDRLVIAVTPEDADAVRAFVASLGDARVVVDERHDPRRGLDRRWSLLPDEALEAEAYVVEPGPGGSASLRGADRLGRLYALSAALEQLGWRFPHPQHTLGPDALDPSRLVDEAGRPEVARRGLHLHTLHPIEGLYDAWIPSEDGAARMDRVFDWIVRNRGNHVQWVALDDITNDPVTAEAWRDHTEGLVEAAHLRGLSTGLAIQLFGQANLQSAFDLVDRAEDAEGRAAEMGPRLDTITGLGFDLFNLSFGEFFGAEPTEFVAAVEETYDALQARQPGVELTATLHVGDDLRVTWEGKDTLYYYLALEADRPITPWVHTVMFYGLHGDAGGAYEHDDFGEHRDLLLERLRAGQRVGYFPESAYWIAFDNPIPQFLPLYVTQRWRDLATTREVLAGEGALQDHVLFSSGWEWGYGLVDAATLRMTYTLPDAPFDGLAPLFHDPEGRGSVPEALTRLAAAQDAALLDGRLTPWLASQDAMMEVGYGLGIVSQPERPSIAALVDAADADLDALRAVASGLAAHQADVDAIPAPSPAPDDPSLVELADALATYRARVAFVRAWVDLALAEAEHRQGGPAPQAAAWDALDALLDGGQALVDRRHARLWDPVPDRLVALGENPTIYDYGYLIRADELCFWRRERAQLRAEILSDPAPVPGCAL